MAPQEKKKGREPVKEEPEEESEESEEESSEEEDSEEEEDLDGSDDDDEDIMVDFEFQDPTEIDFHGLKALLGNYLDGAEFSSSPLCAEDRGDCHQSTRCWRRYGSRRRDVRDEHSG